MAYAHRYHKSSRVIYKYRPSRRQWNFRRTLDTIKIPISNDAYLTKVITIHFLVFHSFPSRIYIPSDLISRFCAPNSLRVFLIHLKKKKNPLYERFENSKKKKEKNSRTGPLADGNWVAAWFERLTSDRRWIFELIKVSIVRRRSAKKKKKESTTMRMKRWWFGEVSGNSPPFRGRRRKTRCTLTSNRVRSDPKRESWPKADR